MNRASFGRLAALCLAGSTITCAARADVFEIADDGSVQTRGGSGLTQPRQSAPDPGDDRTPLADVPEVPATAVTEISPPDVPSSYAAMLIAAGRHYDVSPTLLAALVARESEWRPSALSNKGAIGLAQLMPATARALAVDPHDAAANLDGAAHYLRQMLDLFDGDVERALAAYNAGPRRVLAANGVPPIRETRTYVSTIINRLALTTPARTMGEAR